MTSKTLRWSVGFGGRVAHAWNQVGVYRTEFAALCSPSLSYGNGWDATGYKRCSKCEKLVNVQTSES
jgi:hypothetical protein